MCQPMRTTGSVGLQDPKVKKYMSVQARGGGRCPPAASCGEVEDYQDDTEEENTGDNDED